MRSAGRCRSGAGSRTGRSWPRRRRPPGSRSTRPCARRFAAGRGRRTSSSASPATRPCHQRRRCDRHRASPTAPARRRPHARRSAPVASPLPRTPGPDRSPGSATAAWLVTHCSKSAVRDLLRIAWRTVGSIVTRVVADAEATTDRFANLRRIGIDEISYKRGHKYLTVIVDHDTGVLLWARPGRDSTTLEKFFDSLGVQRCAQITLVSADAAEWIATVVAARCQNAELCLDPFHIVAALLE